MVDEVLVTDLFGDAVALRREGRGRPEHVWSLENSNKVLLAFARGLTVKQAASTVGVSVPTLRKVYFSEVAKRAEARLRMEMTQLSRLNGLAQAGNVSAEKELLKQMERLRQRDQQQALAPAPIAKPVKKGKKVARIEAAHAASGLYDTPPGPGRMN